MFELTLKLILFLFPLAYSPGPGSLFFAANGARFGFAATIAANTGYHIATLLVAVAIGMGFGLVANEFPAFLLVIKYAGSAYVLYLAWLLVKAGAVTDDTNPRHASFWDGVILLILNPKAYLIIALIFTQFTSSIENTSFWLVAWVSIIFTLNNLVAFSIWAAIGDVLASAFRNEAHARKLNTLFGAMLALVAIWMLLR